MDSASTFFEHGSLGYSETGTNGRFDGLELKCEGWRVEALEMERIESSYFGDPSRFPDGTATFDCALLMRDTIHAWHGRPDLCCSATGV
ncbi:hypothetical protein [Novipirellula artificiosorum]|uniref:hypothetical protein n=1 Tax=Novipirellula artificiosorum TaxID=2528016 RepID=UPI0011B3E44F|nr:hypothetical protein [Novipirellula artificiosorum]